MFLTYSEVCTPGGHGVELAGYPAPAGYPVAAELPPSTERTLRDTLEDVSAFIQVDLDSPLRR